MVIKINPKLCAVLLSLILVFSAVALENALPKSITADVADETEENASVSLPVLMYHHLSKNPKKLGDYVVSPAQLEEDLCYIEKKGYTAISASELIGFIEGSCDLPEKPIMITFDDGYESVHEYAFPILKKHNMKAVISIIGKHTDIFSNPDEPRHINYSHVSWEQLREMQESGLFEVGNHSYDMHESGRNGTRYGIRIKKGESAENYRRALENDIGGLNEKMKNELSITPEVFAYPFGALCRESKPILKEMGFKLILVCEEKVNRFERGTELPVSVRRYNRASKYSTYEYFKKMGIE